MRRPEFALAREAAIGLLAQAPQFQLAGVLSDGSPVLKTVHGVIDGGWLCFHSSPKGEKTSLLGQPIVACIEDVVARVPSYFLDPVRACPATTLYRSVQVHGVVEAIDDEVRKARVLDVLMQKLQPEGGYRAISADDPMYRAAVRGLLIAGVPLERLDGKAKLAQNRSLPERARLLEQLWQRGGSGDPRAIELIRAANPEVPGPFSPPMPGVSMHGWLDERDVDAAVALVASEYWNEPFSAATLRKAHLGSSAWVGAKDAEGALIGTARAIADGARSAWVYDVAVARTSRRRGIGQALMRVLLAHPSIRHCQRVMLGTRDAQSLYARFGFVPKGDLPPRPFSSTEMVLSRAGI